VVGRFVKRFGNRTALVIGLMFGAAGLAVAGLAPNSNVFWLGIPVLALWGISGAANQTIMSHHVSPSEQGQLQGANASLTSISELIGPLIFPLIFAYFVTPGHSKAASGAPFLLGCVLLAFAALWAWWATRRERDDHSSPEENIGRDSFETGLGVPLPPSEPCPEESGGGSGGGSTPSRA